MCGIAGVFHFDGKSTVDAAVLASMRDAMAHRGPDGAGCWISPDKRVGLAHRRLAIVNLSPNAAQPMRNEDGAIWVTFNGEIYNHLSLRAELISAGHAFRTSGSDTEVLVHGYEEWGLDGLLDRISGDYAFGIWDGRRGVLSLARDRIGVKPLYFSLQTATLLFASEIKAILKHPGVERDIDPSAMYHYLTFLTTPAPMTMFKGVYKLPSGWCMQVDNRGKITAHRYWDALPGQGIMPDETKGLSETALERFYVNGIRARLSEAVKERMMSDVPFGVFLSGGIDSSTNVALMAQLTDRPVETFTVGFKDYPALNELDYAKVVSRQFKTNHHEILINEHDMVGYLGQLVHHQDEPLADWVCIPLYFVSRLARDSGVTVIQVGEGSDENFSGYAGYMLHLDLYRRYWRPFRTYVPPLARRAVNSAMGTLAMLHPGLEYYSDIVERAVRSREQFWTGAVAFWDTMKRQLMVEGSVESPGAPEELIRTGILPSDYLEPDSYNVVRSFVSRFDSHSPTQDILNRMIYNELKLRLPELLLMRVDKITMSTSLEARVPFLAHKLVEFAMDIPVKWKTRDRTAKYLLKKAVQGLIPDQLIHRRKMGFSAPMSQWLRGRFGAEVKRSILSSPLMSRGFFRRDYVEGLLSDHASRRRDNSLYIWTLFNLSSWYDYWIDPKLATAA